MRKRDVHGLRIRRLGLLSKRHTVVSMMIDWLRVFFARGEERGGGVTFILFKWGTLIIFNIYYLMSPCGLAKHAKVFWLLDR